MDRVRLPMGTIPTPPPPPLGTISNGGLPIAHKITPSQLRRLYPTHAHHNIHVKSSFDFYSKSSWFAIRPFKWAAGIVNIGTWPMHDDFRDYTCHLCSTVHPMEPLAQLALCPATDHIRQLFMHAWPQPFCALTQQWWSSSPPAGDGRNFIRTLVPSTLHTLFLVPTSGQSKMDRRRQFAEALPARRRALQNALTKSVEWLRDNGPPLPRPPALSVNTWGKPQCPFSTSHSPPPPNQEYLYKPPDPIPQQVARPQARKRAAQATSGTSSKRRRAQPPQARQRKPGRKRRPDPPPQAPKRRNAGPSRQTTLFFAPPPPQRSIRSHLQSATP